MGGGQFYLYMYALCCAAVSALFMLGSGLFWWGRRKERLATDARKANQEAK